MATLQDILKKTKVTALSKESIPSKGKNITIDDHASKWKDFLASVHSYQINGTEPSETAAKSVVHQVAEGGYAVRLKRNNVILLLEGNKSFSHDTKEGAIEFVKALTESIADNASFRKDIHVWMKAVRKFNAVKSKEKRAKKASAASTI